MFLLKKTWPLQCDQLRCNITLSGSIKELVYRVLQNSTNKIWKMVEQVKITSFSYNNIQEWSVPEIQSVRVLEKYLIFPKQLFEIYHIACVNGFS